LYFGLAIDSRYDKTKGIMSPEQLAAVRESRTKLVAEISEIEERYKSEIGSKKEILRAYDVVLEHAQANGQTPANQESNIMKLARILAEPGYGYNTKVVRQAIQRFDRPFTIRDIQEALAQNGINLDVSSVTIVIHRLRQGEHPEIRVRQQGSGRRPTYYVRT
jgi:hypothetical protein